MKTDENTIDITPIDADKTTIEVRTVGQLQQLWDEVFLIKDRGALWVFLAAVIGNQLDQDPIWLHLIAPPSSGKTEFIDSLKYVKRYNKDLVFPISDLTVNTFASGSNRGGKDTSLLNEVKRGSIIAFKDFTSMISKEPIAQKAIMGQLREIYDRTYVKRTGNGKNIKWEGKVGIVTGCTQVIYNQSEEFAAMGDRFMMYQIEQPDQIEAMKMVYRNTKDNTFDQKREGLKLAMKSYLEYCFEHLESVELDIPDKTVQDIIKVVNFTTQVSSGLIIDPRKDNRIEFVPQKTMPMRMFKQVLGVARAFLFMNKIEAMAKLSKPNGDLTPEQIKYLYKLCFDSIPIRRRMALQVITGHFGGATTAGLATKLGYQTPVIAGWLAQLNGLGIVRREKEGLVDKWFLKPEFQDIMVEFEGITPVEGALDDSVNEWDEKIQAMEYNPIQEWYEDKRSMEEEDYGKL